MDHTFRDLMEAQNPALGAIPFGGKLVVFGGDFRQTMPIIRRAGASYVYVSLPPSGRSLYWLLKYPSRRS